MSKRVRVVDRNTLWIRPKDLEGVLLSVPGAVEHGDGCTVPWDLTTCRRVAALGETIISTLTRDYSFPGLNIKPLPHQYKVMDFLVRNKRAFCFADMGLGKTLMSCWAMDFLRSQGYVDKVLIVCPLSITRESWGNTLEKHFRHLSVGILVGSGQKRRKMLAETNYDVYITNFDGVKILEDELVAKNFDHIIVDESTAYKNPSTSRWRAMDNIVNPKDKARRRPGLWMLTGTPVPQGPMDAFGQAKLLRSPTLPRTMTLFRAATMYQVAPLIWKARPESAGFVRKCLTPAIYMNKRQVLKDHPVLLPPIYRQVEMSADQKKAFKALLSEYKHSDGEQQITAVNAGVRLLKLLQIAGGVVYDDNGENATFDSTPRIREIVSLIEQSVSKTLVYVPFRNVLHSVADALRKEGIRLEVIYGDVPLKERERIIKEFQEGDSIDVIVAIPNAIQHGIDAFAASTVVWALPQSKNEVYRQASNRIDRIGQIHPMTIAHIYSHDVEKKLYEAQQHAESYEKAVLSLYNELVN